MISLKDASPDERLRIYLNDHLAGATAGIALAKRIAERNTGEIGQTFKDLIPDLEDDERTLQSIIAAMDFPTSGMKQKLADVVEKVGRLKLNGQILGYSLLSKMEELEVMSLGIEGKAKLWSALATVAERRPQLAKFDFETLGVQARLQHDRVDALRLEAAREALAVSEQEAESEEREPATAS